MAEPENFGPEHFDSESFFYWQGLEQQLDDFMAMFKDRLALEGVDTTKLLSRLCLDKVCQVQRRQMWDSGGGQVPISGLPRPDAKKQLQAEVAFLFPNDKLSVIWLRVINTMLSGAPINAETEGELLQQGYNRAEQQLEAMRQRANLFVLKTGEYIRELGRSGRLRLNEETVYKKMMALFTIHDALSPGARASATDEIRLLVIESDLIDRNAWLPLVDYMFTEPYAPPAFGQAAGS